MNTVKTISLLCLLSALLGSCKSRVSPPPISPTDVMETSKAFVKTEIVMTLTAAPTSTPSPLPTFVLAPPTVTPAVLQGDFISPPPQARLDYALAYAPKIYNRLPYIGEAGLSGEYSGCADSNDFSNAVYYGIERPLDIVTLAFDKYFQQEKWAFTEATTEWVGSEIKVPEVSYDVYRILPTETPAFERLRITLRDESTVREGDYIDVRLFLTHVETKKVMEQFFYSSSCGLNNQWLWIHLGK